jgi:hypothetical protein
VWTAGLETGANEQKDHPIIRRFDKSGKPLPPLLLRSSFKIEDTARYGHPVMHSYLVSATDRVGWYSESAGVYIEFAADGSETGRYTAVKGAPSGNGIAMCSDGSLYVAGRNPAQGASPGIYTLDRARNLWTFFPHPTAKAITLYGCDEQGLLVQTGVTTFETLRRP